MNQLHIASIRNRSFRRGRVDHLACLAGVDREGLLAQHVLPGVERGDRHPVVFAVRRADVDDVDVGIGPELVVRAVCVWDRRACGEVVSGGLSARADGDDLGTVDRW